MEYYKKQLYWAAVTFSIIILVISLIGNYRTTKELEEQSIAINRSPLQSFRFLEYREASEGFFIDIVSLENGKKYENTFLSASCPFIKDKKPGIVMKLSVVEYMKPATEEKFYRLDRAYDYLCTNLNMAEEDEKLLKRIKEARERELQYQLELSKKQ